ncbi:MAG: hypothetical protein JNL60_14220 [Bacteroidia bacterium]|nr:hypothetical protein [Bacteroidia bacterium]
MKKLIVLASAIILGSAFASCKKEYKCECEKTYTGSSASITIDDGTYTYKDTKARAISRCNDQEGTGTDGVGDYTRDCEIR